MKIPAEGSKVTQEQVEGALNIVAFPGAAPGDKAWHYGQFEPWALEFGYPEGKPLYANITMPDSNTYHIYYLNDAHKSTIILKHGQTPANYGISPEKAKASEAGGRE